MSKGEKTIPLSRFDDLMHGRADLAQDEIDAGWHFCSSWGGLLVLRQSHGCYCAPIVKPTIAQFPDRRHALQMDEVTEKVRALILDNDQLSYAESIAILELVKFDIMRDMQSRFGVDEE